MEIFIFILGLCLGSFANVLIDRLPQGQDVFRGRSRCDHCKKNLRWFELVPVISFCIQGGRCRRCRKSLSFQYPLVEIVMGVGLVLLYQTFNYSFISLFAYSLILFALLVIFVADFKYEIIPDSMIVIGLLGGLLQGVAFWISGIGAAGFFFLLWLITGGRGMGFGDIKLVFLLGFILGFPNIVVALYTAFLTGAAIGIILMMGGKKTLKSHVPFGPFLVLGAVFALRYGTQVMEWWRILL